jgi:hypothetical protein
MRPASKLALCGAVSVVLVSGPAHALTAAQPVRLTVSAPSVGCPGIRGTFVTLLDSQRGFLLLAGHAFPGARGPVVAKDNALSFRLSEGSTWSVEHVEVDNPSARVWFARYRFRGTPTDGCVAFDREQFSSEGDLVSYVQWLVEMVYLRLPAEERRHTPAFLVSNRLVRLRVERGKEAALQLSGKEAAALAFRFPGDERTSLLVPYILDEGTGRLAVEMARAAELTPPGTPRESLGFAVVTVGSRVQLAQLQVFLTVEGIDPAR